MCILTELKTPAEKFLGRILRTPLSDLQLKKTRTQLHRNDQEMEEVKSGRKEFAEEDAVFAREFSDPNHPKWVSGRIKRRLGRHVYEVEVRGKMPRSTCESAEEARDRWCTEDNVWHIWPAISSTKWDATGSIRSEVSHCLGGGGVVGDVI